ncbi:MAG: phosphoribosylaminoimidazolesuccinocarboxamide synthase [Ardenticatenaceae bacterium]
MLSKQELRTQLSLAFRGAELSFLGEKLLGKVRDNYRVDGLRILVATDRLSAFDRILGLVPFKGQVLNQLAAFWFERTSDIVGNHLIELPDPNVTVARECRALPVEVVVRGYLTGVTTTALWYQYSLGQRNIYGIEFPNGLKKNDALPKPIITPTTKAEGGAHDERLTSAEVVERGLVVADLWEQVQQMAIALFQRGQEIAHRDRLILVDTKYEFGLAPDGELLLIDEIHTPDSSRFWLAESYETRRAAGDEPENFDKEFIRLHYTAAGYRGEGEPMPLPGDLAVAAAQRYIRTYEMLTGAPFQPGAQPTAQRVERNLRAWHQRL